MHIDLTVLLYHHAPNNYIQWVTLNIMPRLAFFPSVHSMQWVTWYNLYRPAWWVLCSGLLGIVSRPAPIRMYCVKCVHYLVQQLHTCMPAFSGRCELLK